MCLAQIWFNLRCTANIKVVTKDGKFNNIGKNATFGNRNLGFQQILISYDLCRTHRNLKREKLIKLGKVAFVQLCDIPFSLIIINVIVAIVVELSVFCNKVFFFISYFF